MATVLPTALALAKRGFAVFPVNWPVEENGRLVCSCMKHKRGPDTCNNAAKHPYGKLAPNGLLSATTESGIIKHWFGLAAPESNLGLCTDRLVVIDVDPRHDGDASLAALKREYGELPVTWRVVTGGGGASIWSIAPGLRRISRREKSAGSLALANCFRGNRHGHGYSGSISRRQPCA
jgi:hypothetical protein